MAYRTPYWETKRMEEEKRADRLAEIASREAGLTKRARVAATPARPAATPRAEAPYLPESLKEGRLGDIMRASPKELESIYERMPEAERPVHLIRGAEESYFSPGTRQEYGDLRTAMAGFRQRPAAVAKLGAEAEDIRYGTEFKRGLEDVLAGTVRAYGREAETRAGEAALGLREAERGISLRDEAGVMAAAAAEAEVARPSAPAKPGRKMRPSLKRLWRLTPPGAALYGYKNIADWIEHGIKEGYEYAFPRTK